MTGRITLVTVTLARANEYVGQHHRHHRPVVGHKFSIGCEVDGELRGVCIVGRPVARGHDDGTRLEVTRLCTDGAANACSFLYGAAARAAKALGYATIGTYVLASECGVSLRAAGWRRVRETKGGSWSCRARRRCDNHPTEPKVYWERELA